MKQHAHVTSERKELLTIESADVLVIDPYFSGAGLELPTNQPKQGGFTRAAWSHNRDHLASGYVQTHAIKDTPGTSIERDVFNFDVRGRHMRNLSPPFEIGQYQWTSRLDAARSLLANLPI